MLRYRSLHRGPRRRTEVSSREDGRRDFKVLPLVEVRKQALAIMARVAKGEDPVAEAATVARTMTLKTLFAQRLAKDGDRSGGTLANYKRVLDNDVFPKLGHLPANAITADQIADVLKVVEVRCEATQPTSPDQLSGQRIAGP